MTYNGIRKHGVSVLEKSRPYWATRTHELLDVPGMPGAYLSDTKIEVLRFDAVLDIYADSPNQLRRMAEDLAAWFAVDEPKPLIFDDDPSRTYFALITGDLKPDEHVSFASLPISILCPDPHKYGNEKVIQFTEDVRMVVNNGTANAKPTFIATALGSLTNIDIVTDHGYMRIGEPAPINAPPIAPEVVEYTSELSNTTGWLASNTVADNGTVGGTMVSDGNGFRASSFGATVTPYAWRGPALKRSLPTPLQDFKIEAAIQQLNTAAGLGMIEIYMLNAAGAVVCKMGFEDVWRYTKANQFKYQLGAIGTPRTEYHWRADYDPYWNDFKGVIRVERKGIHWRAYIAQVDAKGKHYNISSTKQHFDYANKYTDPIAQIQISIRKWGDPAVPETNMRVDRITVWKLNQNTVFQPLYIAHAGDVVEIDHMTGNITVNGEPRLWLKDFGSKFFPLKPGENTISVAPINQMSLQMIWRERFV